MHLELSSLKPFKIFSKTEDISTDLHSIIDYMDNGDSLQSNQSFIQIESTTSGTHDSDDESYTLHYNESFYLDDFREHVALEKFFLYCLVFTGSLTNLLTLIQMLVKKRQKSGSHVLLFHLILSDFMMIAFDILPEIYWYENFVWPAGDFACKIFHVLRKFALYSNSFVIVCISFNRYYLLKEPHIFQKEKQRAYRMLKLAYSASALLSTPELYLFSVQPHPDFGYLQCVGFDKLPELWQLKAYNAYHLLGMYLLPLHLIIYLYTRIISSLTLKKHVARMTNSASSEERLSQKTNYMLKTKKKAITTFLAVTITFVVCWTPYCCLVIIHISGDEGIISETLDAVMRMFYLLTSTLNPIVHNSNIFEKLFFCKSSVKPCPLPTVRLRSLGRNHEASGSDLKPINCSNNTIRFKP